MLGSVSDLVWLCGSHFHSPALILALTTHIHAASMRVLCELRVLPGFLGTFSTHMRLSIMIILSRNRIIWLFFPYYMMHSFCDKISIFYYLCYDAYIIICIIIHFVMAISFIKVSQSTFPPISSLKFPYFYVNNWFGLFLCHKFPSLPPFQPQTSSPARGGSSASSTSWEGMDAFCCYFMNSICFYFWAR